MTLESFVHRQSGKAEDGKGISWQASAQVSRQLFCNHLSTGDSDKSGDMVALDGDIGCSNVVSKLILTGIALKEAVEVDVSATEPGSVVPGFQSPDSNFLPRVNHETALSRIPWVDFPG